MNVSPKVHTGLPELALLTGAEIKVQGNETAIEVILHRGSVDETI